MVQQLSINDDDWLEPLSVYPVPAFQSGDLNPKYIVLHGTNLRSYGKCLADWTQNTDTKESMHLLISQTGVYFQLAKFTRKVWHCGASNYQGYYGLNNWAIGIALESVSSQKPYSDEQLVFLDALIPVMVQTYNIRDIVLSSYISEDSKNDLGPNFPMNRYWPYVRYGNADSAGRFAVVSPQPLNVRGGPNVLFEIIDKLEPGDGIKVLQRDFEWAFISYDKKGANGTGWVLYSYLRRL